jgi:hypothetical protein
VFPFPFLFLFLFLSRSAALHGSVVMSSRLELVFHALLNGKVPRAWMDVSYPSRKAVAAYLVDLVARVAEFSKWVADGRPATFWLPGFFFTQVRAAAWPLRRSARCSEPRSACAFDAAVATGVPDRHSAGARAPVHHPHRRPRV